MVFINEIDSQSVSFVLLCCPERVVSIQYLSKPLYFAPDSVCGLSKRM